MEDDFSEKNSPRPLRRGLNIFIVELQVCQFDNLVLKVAVSGAGEDVLWIAACEARRKVAFAFV